MSTTNTNSLHKIMTLIDNHSEEIPEGDYLDMCNTLRDIFRNGETQTRRTRTLPSSLRINPMDVIFERCMVLVRKRKEYKKLINLTKPRIRITNIFKREAIHAYCGALELPLCNTIEDLNTLGYHPQDDFFKDYLNLTNSHKLRQREEYIQQLDEYENEIIRIDNFNNSVYDMVDIFYDVSIDGVPPLT